MQAKNRTLTGVESGTAKRIRKKGLASSLPQDGNSPEEVIKEKKPVGFLAQASTGRGKEGRSASNNSRPSIQRERGGPAAVPLALKRLTFHKGHRRGGCPN